jgi:hypothetical protein
MDVHRWRADCLVHIADIWERRGDIVKSVELWNAARPLFQRSSQAKDLVRIDRKLTDMNFAVRRNTKSKIHQTVLYAPIGVPGEADPHQDDEVEQK